MVKEIADYIEKARAHGLGDNLIRSNLLAAGWDEKSVAESFASPNKSTSASVTAPVGAKPRRGFRRIVIIIAAVILLSGVGFAAYYFYGDFTFSSEQLWTEAIANAKNQESGQMDFVIQYHEQLPLDPAGDSIGGALTLGATGKSYFQARAGSTDSEITARVTSAVSGFNFDTDVEARNIGTTLYYKIGNNSDSSTISGFTNLGSADSGKWYRMDSDAQNNIRVMAQTEVLLKNADSLTVPEYLGDEDSNGAALAHYRAQVDKNKLAEYFQQTPVTGIETKLTFEPIEVWINKTEARIVRLKLSSNFPAFVNGSSQATNKTPAEARDSKRLADIRQIQAALEIYLYDNNRYPPATNGLPKLPGTPGSSTLPFAPKPADGACTDTQNLYWYEPTNANKGYELKFCLGTGVEGYSAGLHTATSTGITPPAGPVVPPRQIKFIDFPYSAKLDLDVSFSLIPESKTIVAPSNAIPSRETREVQGETNLGK